MPKQSKDPKQQAIRQHKADLNSEVSEFIDNLINFKKLMNGKPSKYLNEKSFITEPIPVDSTTILNNLVSNFNEIARESNSVVKQQIEYSQTRKKKLPNKTVSQQTLPITANHIDDGFLVLSSNRFTRFYTKLKLWGFRDTEINNINLRRKSLLDNAVEMDKYLKLISKKILTSSSENISLSIKAIDDATDNLSAFNLNINEYADILTQKKEMSGKEESQTTVKENEEKSQNVTKENEGTADVSSKKEKTLLKPETSTDKVNDQSTANLLESTIPLMDDAAYINNIEPAFFASNSKTHRETISSLRNLKKLIETNGDEKDINKALKLFNINYANLANWAAKQKNVELQTFTFKDLSMALLTTANELESNQQMLKIAIKALDKLRHRLFGNKTSSSRLEIAKNADSCRDDLDDVMNSLQDGLNIDFLKKKILKLAAKYAYIKKHLIHISSIIEKTDPDKMITNLLQNKEVYHMPYGVDDETKNLLRRNLERQRIRSTF